MDDVFRRSLKALAKFDPEWYHRATISMTLGIITQPSTTRIVVANRIPLHEKSPITTSRLF
jgi:hypothetical protein